MIVFILLHISDAFTITNRFPVETVSHHRVPLVIISKIDIRYYGHFWGELKK